MKIKPPGEPEETIGLRDYFAAHIIGGASACDVDASLDAAAWVYRLAAAMIEARDAGRKAREQQLIEDHGWLGVGPTILDSEVHRDTALRDMDGNAGAWCPRCRPVAKERGQPIGVVRQIAAGLWRCEFECDINGKHPIYAYDLREASE